MHTKACGTWARAALVALVPAGVWSCGGTSELVPRPDPGGLGLPCEGAYVIGSDLERPARIEVWNETDAELRITLDGCRSIHHLGWVRAGGRTTFPLPETLVAFPDGLRFHVFRVEPGQAAGTHVVDPRGTVARLVIRPDMRGIAVAAEAPSPPRGGLRAWATGRRDGPD